MYALIPLVLLCLFSVFPGAVPILGWVFFGEQIGGRLWGVFDTRGRPVLLSSPVAMSSYWWRRLTILAIEVTLLGVAFRSAEWALRVPLQPSILLSGAVLAMFGASVTSFLALWVGLSFARASRAPERRALARFSRLKQGIVLTVVNIGLLGTAIFNQEQPVAGVFVDVTLTATLLVFGLTYLHINTPYGDGES